jgi:phosphocarrier protein HPr
MLTKTFSINCSIGLHARPASVLVDKAGKFKSSITMKYKGTTVPLNSIIGVMALGVESGQNVEVIISGEDQEEAMIVMENFFEKEIQEL